MSRYDELKALAKEAHERGDRETAERAMDAMESMRGGRSIGERVTGAAEAAVAVGSAALAPIPAGIVGLGTLITNMGDPYAINKSGAAASRQLQGTYQPKTEAGREYLGNVGEVLAPVGRAISAPGKYLGEKTYQATGSAGLATLAGAGPEVALAILGMPKPKPATTPGFLYDASGLPNPPPVTRARIEPKVGSKTDPAKARAEEYGQITKNIDAQKAALVAEDVKPNRQILEASKRQGIELNPSSYSQSQTYIELEQALKSRPNSGISAREAASIRALGEKADGLIETLGGSVDKGVFDVRLRRVVDGSVDDLAQASKRIREGRVNARIPRNGLIEAKQAKGYIEGVLKDLGGNKNRLSPPEKALLDLLDEKQPLTYASLDRLRRDVGNGFERLGPYADADSAILNKVYGVLSSDQLAAADSFGVGNTLRLANRLDQSRFEIQKAAQALFSRDLEKSVLPKVRTAASDLVKGNSTSFTSMINTVPTEMRRQTAVAVLNEVFTQGTRTGGGVGGGFATAYRSLTRNKSAYETLMRELPPGARQTFDDLGKIADGIYRAKALENTSKTARDVIAALDNPRTFERIYKGAAEMGALETVTSSVGLPPGSGAIVGFAHNLLKKRTPGTIAADNFIGSNELRKAIDLVARGDIQKAEQLLSKSQKAQAWAKTLSETDAAAVSRVGVIGWLTSQDEEPE